MADARADSTSRGSASPGRGSRATLRCVNASVLKDDSVSEIVLQGPRVTVGRGVGNDVQVKADGVSRDHACLVLERDGWQIEDTGSKNGTRVNSSILKGRRPLADGDTVTIGRAIYKFSLAGPPAPPASVRNLDLGGNLETIVMRPEEVQANLAASGVTRRQAAGQARRPGTAGRHRAVPAKSGKRTGVVLWVLAILLAVVVLAAADALLQLL